MLLKLLIDVNANVLSFLDELLIIISFSLVFFQFFMIGPLWINYRIFVFVVMYIELNIILLVNHIKLYIT